MAISSITSTQALQPAPVTAGSNSAARSTSAGASLIKALGGGSGVDVSALASNLVAAERAPQQALIDKNIDISKVKISGYGAVLSSLSTLKATFSSLQDKSNFNVFQVQSNAVGYFDVITSPGASAGTHNINVLALASAQTTNSNGFSSSTAALNVSSPMTLNVTVGGQSSQPPISVAGVGGAAITPQDIVKSINDSDKNIEAKIVNSGTSSDPYKIVVISKATGVSSAFTIAAVNSSGEAISSSILNFSTTPQVAANSHIVVDGIDFYRSSNSIADAISGVTLNILDKTSIDGTLENSVAGRISIDVDSSAIKANVKSLIDSFNGTQALLKAVSDRSSAVPEVGGALVHESLVRQIQSQLTHMVVGNSSTPAGGASALRDVGVTIQRDGTLALDSTKLDSALSSNYTNVITMFTANKENSKNSLAQARGLAGDAVYKIGQLMAEGGPILNAESTLQSKISSYNQRSVELESRMQKLQEMYTRQFTAMENLVGQLNSLKTSLANQFTAWANQKN